MFKKFSIPGLAAALGLGVFLIATANGSAVQAKPKCKVIKAPYTCQLTKAKAIFVAKQKLIHYVNTNYSNWKIVKAKVYCRKRIVHGQRRVCCGYKARICYKPTFGLRSR